MNMSFDTEIASDVGVNAAVVFENIYWWIKKNAANKKHFYDGNYWTYNSVSAFQEIFDFMSIEQIRYAIQKLLEKNYIIKGNYNQKALDHTKWYALGEVGLEITNFKLPKQKLKEKMQQEEPQKQTENTICENSQVDLGKFPNPTVINNTVNNHIDEIKPLLKEKNIKKEKHPPCTNEPRQVKSENQNEQLSKAKEKSQVKQQAQAQTQTLSSKNYACMMEILDYLNRKCGSSYPASAENISLIQRWLLSGYGLQDFQSVIDKKAAEWLDDPKMVQWLRPKTLFGNKFEEYLQAPSAKQKSMGGLMNYAWKIESW